MEALVMRIYALKCPNCGAALEVADSLDVFACSYCGATVQVERGTGTISLQLLTKTMRSIQRSSDRTAAELAIRRLREELVELEKSLIATLSALPVMLRPGVESPAEVRVQALRGRIEDVKAELEKQLAIVAS
jgi:ribosomal protein S27AE